MKGYIHKIGKVWYTTVDLPRLRGEKRHQKSIRLGKMSKGEAEAKEREVLRQLDQEGVHPESNATVEEVLREA